jgi:23S rRNA pseudouridine1911/1915/1917 synthase
MQIDEHIIYDVDDVTVLNKPSGITTSGQDLDDPDCLQWHLMQHYDQMVWAVHQIDKLTTGINVFVRKKSLVPVWQERLRHPIARKDYLAICHGDPGGETMRIEDPIGERGDGLWGITHDGKESTTIVERLQTTGDASLLRCRIKTGRTNQIRVHLSEYGYPLFGEGRYQPADDDFGRHALHAWRVKFSTKDEPWEFRAPLPVDMTTLLKELGFDIEKRWLEDSDSN